MCCRHSSSQAVCRLLSQIQLLTAKCGPAGHVEYTSLALFPCSERCTANSAGLIARSWTVQARNAGGSYLASREVHQDPATLHGPADVSLGHIALGNALLCNAFDGCCNVMHHLPCEAAKVSVPVQYKDCVKAESLETAVVCPPNPGAGVYAACLDLHEHVSARQGKGLVRQDVISPAPQPGWCRWA